MNSKFYKLKESNDIVELINTFCAADKACLFGFTSGNLGALSIGDKKLLALVQSNDLYHKLEILKLILPLLIVFIVLIMFPIKNMVLILRTILRRLSNKRPDFNHRMSVISLGAQPYQQDAYFGTLLKELDGEFDYIKIVGGGVFRSKDYDFVESALSNIGLLNLIIGIFLSPFLSFFYLLNCVRTLNGHKKIILFIILGLKEINSGTFVNNKIIVTSINAFLIKSHTKKVLYPLEGRNWEKNIVQLMNKSNFHSIGYLHCALTPRHLSLTQAGFYKEYHLPSVMVANSEMSSKIFNQIFPNTIIRDGFFLRGFKSSLNLIQKDPNTLLFALTGNIEETSEILNWLAVSEIQENYKVIIRLNPNTSSYAYLSGLAKKLRFNLYTGKEDFLPGVCFFRSSSVALEYLRLNVSPVYVSINEVITNNVFDLDNIYKFTTLKINKSKSNQMLEYFKNIVDDNLGVEKNETKISDYYLNQTYNPLSLVQLLE